MVYIILIVRWSVLKWAMSSDRYWEYMSNFLERPEDQSQQSDLDLLKVLIEYNAALHSTEEDLISALMAASHGGNSDLVTSILSCGLSVHTTNDQG